jgi:hypothetical protein
MKKKEKKKNLPALCVKYTGADGSPKTSPA